MKPLPEFLNEKLKENTSKSELLLEMARVDNPSKHQLKNKSIYIYGNDRTHMTPHFHYYLDKTQQKYLEISILDLKILYSTPRRGVSNDELLTWKNLSAEKEDLLQWLNFKNDDYPENTNYVVLANTWNQNNRDNQIDLEKLKLISFSY